MDKIDGGLYEAFLSTSYLNIVNFFAYQTENIKTSLHNKHRSTQKYCCLANEACSINGITH